LAVAPTVNIEDIRKNIMAIKQRTGEAYKLRQAHESLLSLSFIPSEKDIKELKEELKRIKESIENQRKKSENERLKQMLNELNKKVSAVQEWINNYAIGDAVEMTVMREGLKNLENKQLDEAPLLRSLVNEIAEIRQQEEENRKLLIEIEKEIGMHKKSISKLKPQVKPRVKTEPKKKKITRKKKVKTRVRKEKRGVRKIKKKGSKKKEIIPLSEDSSKKLEKTEKIIKERKKKLKNLIDVIEDI